MPDSPQGSDQTLVCVDCGAQFTFSARDQAFYQERGYQAPRRCKTCRDKRKADGGGGYQQGNSYQNQGGQQQQQYQQQDAWGGGADIDDEIPF